MAAPRHRPVLIASFLLALASVGAFAWLGWRNIKPPEGPGARVQLADTPYTPAIADAAPLSADGWNAPAAQSKGRDWVYDTFTPPEIFYNARSRQFTVKPPNGLAEGEPEEAFGLELVAVKPEPFRLQLIGYVGEEGNWRGTFENVLTGEVFLATAGRRMPNLALSITSLEVRARPIAPAQSMSALQRVATAVVHDEKTGRDITLTHRERHFTGTVFAFMAPAAEGPAREVRVGDSLKLGDATYRIDKIQLAPPAVEVTKESPHLVQPDRRTLAPRETDAAETPEPGS